MCIILYAYILHTIIVDYNVKIFFIYMYIISQGSSLTLAWTEGQGKYVY